MNRFRARLWTDAHGVQQVAQKSRAAGVTVTGEGTAHAQVVVEVVEPGAVGHTLQAPVKDWAAGAPSAVTTS